MKNLLEAMHNLKENNARELTEEEKKSLRDEIFGMVCFWRSGEDDEPWSKEQIVEQLKEIIEDPYGEDGLFSDDALFEIYPELQEDGSDEFEGLLIKEAKVIIYDILDHYGIDEYIEDADKANKSANEGKELTEDYTEKDLQPGAKYYGPSGALITIVEPRKDGLPQFQMTNTNNGKVGKVITMGSYGELAQILSDNHYVKSGKENVEESLQEDVSNLTGENIADSFNNYKAFVANFEPVIIIKRGSNFFIYKQDAKDDNDYKHYCNSKDYVEGWLYGAVQVANGIFKTK